MFSAQGHDPAAQWKLTGSVRKEFDKVVRGYVYTLEGGASTTTTRMKLPKSDKASCEYEVFSDLKCEAAGMEAAGRAWRQQAMHVT